MSSSRRVVLFLDLVLVCAFFLLETTGTHAAAQDSPNGVVAALERKYVITEMTPDHAEVTKDGTIMVVQRGGLYSDPVSQSLATINNNVVDGKIQPLSGTGLWNYSKSDRILHSGDKVYVLKIESKPDSKGDQLKILILTTDPMDVPSQDGQDKFASVITFKFNKGYLNEASPEDVAQAVENILAPDTGSAESPGGPAQAQQAVARPVNPDTAARVAALRAQCQQQLAALRAQAQQQSSDITAAQLAALRAQCRQQLAAILAQAQQQSPPQDYPAPQQQAVAPPPPPAPTPTAPPPTITIGESSTQVLQAMGMPQQMIDLGKKKTYVYKNMKVIFVDDKVSDVQ